MTSTTPPRILLAGGGSAGHVSPLLATADRLRALAPEAVAGPRYNERNMTFVDR